MIAPTEPRQPRILIIRGGAIGDFILTLPAIRLVREAFPAVHLEIIGYRHIAALAERRFYADSVRSIEYGPLAGFFARNGNLDEELCEYFGSFQQVVSFLFDPDKIFEANLRRAGVKNFLPAHVRIDDETHAARQLARPLESLALYLDDPAAVIYPSEEDRAFAGNYLPSADRGWIAIHPGSGSPRKNWPLKNWKLLIDRINGAGFDVLIVGGEADRQSLDTLESTGTNHGRMTVARDLPLPHLAAVLAQCRLFIGHDSGVSHLAAAVGTRCELLFGPTDPHVWAPANPQVNVIAAPEGELGNLPLDEVWERIAPRLGASAS